MAAKSAVMDEAESPAPPLALLLASVDALLLDSAGAEELAELSVGALLWLADSLDGVDALELAVPVLLPHDAMTRLTENSATANADFLPTNIRSPFVMTVTPPEMPGAAWPENAGKNGN
ncbi:MAG: hypothetical protein ABI382_12595 [Nakamurella sp.]